MRGRSSNAKSAGESPCARQATHQQSRCQQGAGPSRGRGFNKERVMMHQVIILIVLLLISFAAY
ncbi:type I toxin-antitoxin system Ibs family toxin [Salmonella enterica subsp. enterica serovar Teko]|nr:type I toxin-antitoxin system Ibs family toxin [Salmonella enterica subsp. enterica serovar Teko]